MWGYGRAHVGAVLHSVCFGPVLTPKLVIVLKLDNFSALVRRDIFDSAVFNLTGGASVESVLTMLNSTFTKVFLDPQQKQFRQLLADIYLATINYNNINYLNGSQSGVSRKDWSDAYIRCFTLGAPYQMMTAVYF